MCEPDVPEYLVDDRPVGDEGDYSHLPAAPAAEKRVLEPDHPDQSRPADASLVDIFVLIRLACAFCLRIVHAAFGLRHGTKTRGVRVGAAVVHEPLVWAGDLNRQAGYEIERVEFYGLACA